jgi:hypothetical protein
MHKIRQGDWTICRERGTGGDVIAGQVESAKYPNGKYPRGQVKIRSLTRKGYEHEKFMDIFLKRNAIVPKKKALQVAKVFREQGKSAAKELAIQICVALGLRSPPRANGATTAPSRKVHKALVAVKRLSAAEKREVLAALAAE